LTKKIHFNLIYSYFGQFWNAFISLIFIPIYIHYIGIESYALIGIFSMFQVWINILDAGITPTISKNVSEFRSGIKSIEFVQNLIRSFELISICLVSIFILISILFANRLLFKWLNVSNLNHLLVYKSFIVMIFAIGVRYFEGIYRGVLIGMQEFGKLNIINTVVITIKSIGALLLLIYYSNSIFIFFIWNLIMSLISLLVFLIFTYKHFDFKTGSFSLTIVRSVYKFTGGIMLISFLSLLLTQVDKILLSKTLQLSDFGYYSLAVTVASIIQTISSPISQVFYPKFCELLSIKDNLNLALLFHRGSQIVTVIAGSFAIFVSFFSFELIGLWTKNQLITQNTYFLVSLLSIGNLINALMWIPYQLQMANNWTRLNIYLNIFSLLFIIPLIYIFTIKYGAISAPILWCILNIFYIFIGMHFMFNKIMINEKKAWYFEDILAPLLPSVIITFFIKKLIPISDILIYKLFYLSMVFLIIFLVSLLNSNKLKHLVLNIIKK
jgi:O-antigen/teichoic acid export membrane protein